MRQVFLSVLVGTAAALTLSTQSHAAELLINGGFEDQPYFGLGSAGNDSGYSGLVNGQLPGWTIVADHAVTIHNTAVYPHITGYSVNLDGEGYHGNNADFYQDVQSLAGAAYDISFDHLGWYQTTIAGFVTVTDLATSNVLYSSTYGWSQDVVHESGDFFGTGTVLRIEVANAHSGYNDNTLIVDNFSLVAVPEPTATLLPLAALSLLARRRR